jgi:predicted neutral ceramidase superfamily lipid hydrolase
MFSQKPPSRQIPGIISYMDFFSTKRSAYSLFIITPASIGFLSMILNLIYTGILNIFYFLILFVMFLISSGVGVLISIFFYSKKAPIVGPPPRGWAIQMNSFFSLIIGCSFLIGQILVIFVRNITFQEAFFILGTIVAYILAYVIYFSFTTVGKYGNLILGLAQPVSVILLYSIFTAQISFTFFIRAIIFFCSSAFIFAIPYAREMSQVSNIYKELTGIGGYPFIRAFVLSMMTEGNDYLIEDLFDTIGIESEVKIQYLTIRTSKSKKLKGLFVIPHLHFGPFKTCGSSDLPAQIYNLFNYIPGITVYHTTNDHSQNLTTRKELNKVLNRIKDDVKKVESENFDNEWVDTIKDVTRKISNSAKLIGTDIDNVPIMFVTRHPLPSDDIQYQIGEEIREFAISNGYKDVIIIDSHNSIIGDEILIKKDSIEGRDLINVAKSFLKSNKEDKNRQKNKILYGVARDNLNEFSEKDGIGAGGMVVHLFKNSITNQKTAFIHFDANNAYVDIRSYILNLLQNRGIERGELTTSDSHTVARQFTRRGYSPIGDKIKLEKILKKLENLIQEAEKNYEEVEFHYYASILDKIRIWGDPKYFDTIMNTLQECLKVSQRLLTLSLILPTFFSLILLLFYYNIQITDIFNIF